MTVNEWQRKAECSTSGCDPDLFFPENLSTVMRADATRKALEICERCPVRAECLEQAIQDEEEFGIWGGMTSEQRRALIRRKRRMQMMEARQRWRDKQFAGWLADGGWVR